MRGLTSSYWVQLGFPTVTVVVPVFATFVRPVIVRVLVVCVVAVMGFTVTVGVREIVTTDGVFVTVVVVAVDCVTRLTSIVVATSVSVTVTMTTHYQHACS